MIRKQASELVIAVSSPCGENWDHMDITEQGRFCGLCKKHVHDFSGLSDAQMIDRINLSEGEICGRMHKNQLNRPIGILPQSPARSPFFTKISAGFLMLGLFENEASGAIDEKRAQQVIYPAMLKVTNLLPGEQQSGKDTLKNVIEGVVRDLQTGEAIPYANVSVAEINCTAITDFQGHFKLILPENLTNDSLLLQINYVGYKTIKIRFSQKDLPMKRDFTFESQEMMLTVGALVITRKVTFWDKVKHPFTWRKRM